MEDKREQNKCDNLAIYKQVKSCFKKESQAKI